MTTLYLFIKTHKTWFIRYGVALICTVTMVIMSTMYQFYFLEKNSHRSIVVSPAISPKHRVQVHKSHSEESIASPFSPYSFRTHLQPEANLSDKYIIYQCVRAHCGGLADRQKGIVMAYIMSQMLHRSFGIIMSKECNFTDFILPNGVNWMLNEQSLMGKTKQILRVIDYQFHRFFKPNSSLQMIFSSEVVYYEGNINYLKWLMKDPLFKNVKWAQNQSEWDIYHVAFSHLFRFAPRTIERYQQFREKHRKNIILCAHFRMGRSDSNPKDTRSPQQSPNVTDVIERLKERIMPNTSVFVATDSIETRELLMNTFPNHFVELEGTFLHVDRLVKNYDCSGMEKAILDQYILSTCHTLFISKSGFSEVAAMIRGSPTDLYKCDQKKCHNVRSTFIQT